MHKLSIHYLNSCTTTFPFLPKCDYHTNMIHSQPKMPKYVQNTQIKKPYNNERVKPIPFINVVYADSSVLMQ